MAEYRLGSAIEDRARLADDAYRMGVELADADTDYREILRGEADFGPSEVIDPNWETFADLNDFDDDEFAEDLFRDNFLKGWTEQTDYLEENEPEIFA